MGRARRDAVAGHPGGRQDRPVRIRVARRHVRRPQRTLPPDRQRGALLGRRRDRHGPLRHLARGRRDLRLRHARPARRVGPAVLRRRGRPEGGRLLRLRAAGGFGRLRDDHAGHATTRPRTSGCSPARRRGSPTAASPRSMSWSPRSTPSLGARGQAAFIVPPGTRGPGGEPYHQEARPARVAHRGRVPRRRTRPRALPAGRQGEAGRPAGPCPGGRHREGPGGDGHLRGQPPHRGRPGAGHRARRVRVRAGVRRTARGVRPADHREPVDRVRPGRHPYRDRGRAPADLAGRMDGP